MIISSIEITGLRGFATKQTIEFATPDGDIGSGLTLLVGPNNSGKSTITEAINAFSGNTTPSFTENKRNVNNNQEVEIRIVNEQDQSIILKTKSSKGSETVFVENGITKNMINPFVIPSRRMFSTFFGKSVASRTDHINSSSLPPQRGGGYNQFPSRLFKIQNDPAAFNAVLEKV